MPFPLQQPPINQPVEGVEWPKGLEELIFGRVFNQQIQGTVWGEGLRVLALGDFFDQALNAVAWPEKLEFLSLGNKFNQVGVLRRSDLKTHDVPSEGGCSACGLARLLCFVFR